LIRADTAERLEQRFRTVPANTPAGPVILGSTPDQSGYIQVNRARRLIPELEKALSDGKLNEIVKRISRGQDVGGIKLDLIVDPLHCGRRYASEKSLRALAQTAREGPL
jgi:hypothetical protein